MLHYAITINVAVIIFPANHLPWSACWAFAAAVTLSKYRYTKPAVFLLQQQQVRQVRELEVEKTLLCKMNLSTTGVSEIIRSK